MKMCVIFSLLLLVSPALCKPQIPAVDLGVALASRVAESGLGSNPDSDGTSGYPVPANPVPGVVLGVENLVKGECDVRARTTAGFICGERRLTDDQKPYAAFQNVPYAKQPVGELRFKELQPPDPWTGNLTTKRPGPICPQIDYLYGPLMTPTGMSEECIHANIYVPLSSLPSSQSPPVKERGLPILVFVHGGGFAVGSGNPDVYGPDYLVGNGVIVITFNYRLNVIGFLSLNSTQIPGNNGLRDMITLLRWVKDNAEYYGGSPDDITLGGQSAGAASVHLLTLSPEAQGLFKRAIIMSGVAINSWYTPSPTYAQSMSKQLLDFLGINCTDPEEVHNSLTKLPLQKIMDANRKFQNEHAISSFGAVIESPLPGVKAVIPEDTDVLLAKGYGKDIPLLIGFTQKECETLRFRYTQFDVLKKIKENPLTMAPAILLYSEPQKAALEKAAKISDRYFHGEPPSVDKFLDFCTDCFFHYPALKVAQYRSKTGGAPTYMYQFSYNSPNSPLREATLLNFKGAGHVEDQTYVFKVNSIPTLRDNKDNNVIKLMTGYVVNFIKYGHPSDRTSWPQITADAVTYLNISSATDQCSLGITPDQSDIISFYDDILA